MADWYEEAYELSLQGLNSTEISKRLNVNPETVRSKIKRMRKQRGTNRENHGSYTPALTGQVVDTRKTSSSKVKYDGSVYTYEDELEIIDGQEITPELIMEAKGLDPNDWDVISFTKNVWQSQSKDGGTIDLCQSKLSVKPKKVEKLTFEDIENFFAEHNFESRIDKPIVTEYNEDGLVLQIDVADAHFGMLAYEGEVGEGNNYDLKIARQRYLLEIQDVINKAKHHKIKSIYFVTLGDLLQIDNDKNSTYKGTIVQADGRLSKIFDYTFDSVNESLKMLRELNAEIHFVFLVGNHDRTTSYFLARCLQVANPDIDFDVSPNPMKAIHFGKVLVGLNHGDFPKKNKGSWLINDYRKEFGESEFVEEHFGHIHNETSQMVNGVMCRSITSMCGRSYYDHQQGYRSEIDAIMSFLWNDETGLQEIWFSKGE